MTTFKNALKRNIQYLDSADFRDREDAQNTLKSLELIKTINKLGLLTFDSQEGVCDRKYGIKERAYVIGLMIPSKAIVFMNRFNIFTDKVAYIAIPLKMEQMPSASWDIPLTTQPGNQHGGRMVKSGYRQKIRQVPTHMSTAIYDKEVKAQKKRSGIAKRVKVSYIVVFDPKWNRKASGANGLHNDIIRMLQ